MTFLRRATRAALAACALAPPLAPTAAHACACGCGVFGVGTSSLFPTGRTGQAWFEYDYMDQDDNRSGTRSAPAADNPDKEIETHAFTLGGQYRIDRNWTVTAAVPYWRRTFVTTDDDTGAIVTARHDGFGDVRLTGIYTGLSPDLSTGITLGVKLPTGDFRQPGFDRDTAIGTGSTDILVGGYHHGGLNPSKTLSYFVQAQWDRPVASQGGYRPGQEFDAAAGVTYAGWRMGRLGLAPLLQVIAVHRDRDGGAEADPEGSGYDRVMLSPGVELSGGDWRLYADVALPVYERYRGEQLAARALVKVILSRAF